MPQPPAYTRQFDFSDFSASNPLDQQPGGSLDAEFDAIKTTTDAVRVNLAKIQRDDGALSNDSVGVEQMKPEVSFGLNEVTDWATATAYRANHGVWNVRKMYRCLVAHTSGVFTTDLAAGKWELLLDIDTYQSAADAGAASAAASATNASTSATAAAGSASAASTSATNASTSAAAAAGSASAAATSATNASGSASAAASSAASSATSSTNANSSATAAAGSASAASTSATNAASSATAAAGSASAASTSATNAASSATAAASSAASSATSATTSEYWAGVAQSAATSGPQQSTVTYLASGGSTTFTGRSVLAVYAQTAGTTLNLDYTTRSSYVEQDAVNGTDASGGTFLLHATAGSGAADSNTQLLLHADGVNGAAEFIDGRGITPFGSYCGYFDGSSYWKVPSSNKIAWGSTQNFTVECWCRITSVGSGTYDVIWDARSTDGSNGIELMYTNANKFRVLGFASAIDITTPGTYAIDTWHHVAVVRASGVLTLYVNGSATITATDTQSYAAQQIMIGARGDGNGTTTTIGWLDQVRVSKIARYTTGFTPPAAVFSRDADTVHLFQFEDGHGAQVLKDDSHSGHEVQLLGNAVVSTAQAKFGSSSIYTGAAETTSGVVVGASKVHGDFNIGSDNFTAHAWVYMPSFPAADRAVMIFNALAGGYQLGFYVSNAGGLKFYASTAGTSYDLANGTACGSISANTWTHLAITRSGTSLYVFVGGVLQLTLSASTSSLFWSNPTLMLGRSSGSSNIAAYFDAISVKRGVADWTTGFTPPVSAPTTDNYTILLLNGEGANNDKVTLDTSENSYGSAQISATSTPVLTFGSTAALSSTQTRGGHGTSLYLDNTTNGYANYSAAANDLVVGHPLRVGGSNGYFCVEGWFYDTGDTDGTIVCLDDTTATIPRFYVVKAGATALQAVYYSSGSVSLTNGTTTNNAWNHFAMVKEPRGWVLYVNGTATASPVNPAHSITYNTANAHDLWIGKYRASLYPFGGYIDAVRITNGQPRYTANFTPATLTQDTDTALLWEFNGSVGQKWVKELSKNSALIAATNARTVSDGVWIAPTAAPATNATAQFKFGSASLYNGASLNVVLPSGVFPTGTGDFTIDFQFRPASVASGYVLDGRSGGDGAYPTLYFSASGTLTYRAATGDRISKSGMSANTWYHVAIVRSSGTTTLYVDGVSAGTWADSTSYLAAPIFLFSTYAGATFFTGYIDEFRVSATARWTSGFTPSTIPYGASYTTGPYWVATKPGSSSLDLSAWSSIDSVTPSVTTPVSTTVAFLISTDAYTTALKRWNGSAWVDTAYSMTWNGTTLTTTATAAQLNAVANTPTELTTGLLALNAALVTSLNVVALLATGNTSYTPILDAVTIGLDEYALLRPVTDYTVTRKKATGAQTLTLTRVAAGNANHVFDYL